ncbi:GGDEF domain-containing protein [Noviherbaspirillum sedimenti]|uniref:diguanylate cyclase n=1 Tax=Noviherbaspirillum sedimenti TaxID=2320865 RepID=A0A3A3G2L3_9BURK|nr:GGDEF domain-containing protein [Noviherbaspirillum sedimenti]RJG02707.1 GGDEF domain-containing protein [Noviherbaspirillum sedimenti]
MTGANHSCGNCEQLRAQLAEKETEVAQLRARMEELGRHDSMTGALNRRSLLETLVAELQRAQRTGHPFCFAVLELDRFAQVSGQYGHLAGDAVLKKMADTAVNLLRTVDRFGRLGGESFGIVLPATWLDQGMIAMGRLRKAIADCDWGETAPGLALTFSGGITTNAFGDSAESMIKRAEQAMRQAQGEGGGRTIQLEEALPVALPGA